MRRLLIVVFLLFFYFLLLRLPLLKTKLNENNFYYKDLFGLVHIRHSSCSWFGPCTYWDTPILGTHSLTFTPLKYSGLVCLDAYAITKNNVYYLGKKQHQVKDPSTFELINNFYAKDSKTVYELCELNVLSSVESDGFQIIGPVCARDPTFVYCFQKGVENADAETFKHVWRGYYKDKKHVYHLGNVLEGVDPNTLELLSWGYFRDSNGIYYLNENTQILTKLITANKDGFMVLTNGYAKDVTQVFKDGAVVPNVSPNGFVVP